MTQNRSFSYSLFAALGSLVMALVGSLALLIVELMAAIFTYFYLAIFQREWFGELIGYSREVLNFCVGQIELWFPSFTNAANATLIGELAPKSMLLLLIGLVVGAAIRLALWIVQQIAAAVFG